ncbi:hypothetical protein CYMTET_30407 [Cymbomonas tetramitiformis]|uniref:Uncharacterized protein n=1 Tax=Cymbomonas tetramitiformis TaxID=36881 RepID=A0AAE0FKG4_9CHLO|nr:hypothetical protein CYMTET_30407 [Cymbomonas tetramitiformis]
MNFAATDHTLHRAHGNLARRSERNERSTLEEIPLSPKTGESRRKTSSILGRKHVSALVVLLLTAVSVWNYQAHTSPYDDRVNTHEAERASLSIAEPSGVTVPSTSAVEITSNATVHEPPFASVKVVKQAGITTAETATKCAYSPPSTNRTLGL